MKNLATFVAAKADLSEKGAALVEYVLLVALISVVAIAAMQIVGQEADQTFSGVGTALEGANG